MPNRFSLCLATVLLLLSGCAITPIDAAHEPPHDWPELKITVHKLDDLSGVCNLRNAAMLAGCAVADFNKGTCAVYVRFSSKEVLEHERMHCRGYDHPGESTFRAAWDDFKRVAAERSLRGRALTSLPPQSAAN
jgi:hypothetical protein